ncbi:GNAT family N-acetyltransferase [Jiangella muralis]|uniref:GNAT family N-acetyltransferase n=1 Tax=Jiangella muralis TaxID=702383 RepID=UPI0009F90990|nr:GNAT family N-acetyltransferase [Jiangella muralis]
MTLDRPRRSLATPPGPGVTVREATGVAEFEAVSALLSRVWNRSPGSSQVTVSLLRALSMTGNYVGAAFVEGRMAGAAVAFFAPDDGSLHSHIAGVDAECRARDVGFLLKCHQRTWALGRGIRSVTWTFDPLVRRNAYFNLVKLGARATAYLPDFYGPMHDGLNRGEESDRLLVEWDLLSPAAVAAADARWSRPSVGEHPALIEVGEGSLHVVPWTGGAAFVPVPEDIEQVRIEDPRLAQAWRHRVRDVLAGAMDRGAEITGFDRQRGYVIAPTPTPAPPAGTTSGAR